MRLSIGASFLLGFFFVVAGVLFIGIGKEEGSVVAKEVQSLITYKIESSNFSIISQKTVPASEVPLSFSKTLKHIAKRLVIAVGLAIDRKSYAMKFEIQSQQSGKHLSCHVRVHGDQVLEIIIRSTSTEDSSATRLQALVQSAFFDYEVPILKGS